MYKKKSNSFVREVKIRGLEYINQPREKLFRYGVGKLETYELIAVLLGTGTRNNNVIKIAKRVSNLINEGVENISIEKLTSIKGVGNVKACELIAGIELGKRILKKEEGIVVLSPQDVWNAVGEIRNSMKENFMIFFLNVHSKEIKRELISMGILDASLVHPREIFEPALKCHAAQILLVHNHPSGSLEPSPADIAITKKIYDAGELIGIKLIDHVIVTKDSWYSFKEDGLTP